MKQELSAIEEEYILEQGMDLHYERKAQIGEICEWCNKDNATEKVKIEGNEIANLCEGCREELNQIQEEYESEGEDEGI